MNESIDERLLEASELFYYAWKFRNSRFVIALADGKSIADIVDDLRVLQSSDIKFNFICLQNPETQNIAKRLSDRGFTISYHNISSIEELDKELTTQDQNPKIFAFNFADQNKNLALIEAAITLAQKTLSERVFYLSDDSGIIENDDLKSFLSFAQVKKIISSKSNVSFPEDILAAIVSQNRKPDIEFSLLKLERGSLFEEIFSHEGHGTLITERFYSTIRKARKSDIISIYRLLQPAIEAGWVLSISEDQIADQIEQFYVYTVNSAVVAAAMLQTHEDSVELAKFCTLPRFQGRGGARELAKKLIEQASTNDKKDVFSLSTNPAMWKLFASLGMKEVARETLPRSWQKTYDMTRPSKAYKLELNTQSATADPRAESSGK